MRDLYDEETGTVILQEIDADLMLEFFGHLGLGKNYNGDGKKAESTINGYRSAIADLYEKAGMRSLFPDAEISKFMKGYSRVLGNEKQSGKRSAQEGKRAITFDTYDQLVRRTLDPGYEASQYDTNPLFLVLAWNLMSRSINIGNLLYDHITSHMDALNFTLAQTKCDQAGKNLTPKAVYANLKQPHLCAFLLLGLNIVSIAKLDKTDNRVFNGGSASNRFSKWLHAFIEKRTPGELLAIGIQKHEYGVHSVRKGAFSYVSCRVFLNVLALWQRMDWGIGMAQRYFSPDEGMDRSVGRSLTGVDVDSEDYTALPPRFTPGFVIPENQLLAMVPGLNNYPACFQKAILLLIASVVYHSDWLKDNLPKNHPYFTSFMYRQNMAQALKPHIITGNLFKNNDSMEVTGVPENIRLGLNIKHLKASMDNKFEHMQEKLEGLRSELNDTLSNELPTKLTEEILNAVNVEGAQPLTMEKVQQCFDQSFEQLSAKIDQALLSQNVSPSEGQLPSPSPESLVVPLPDHKWEYKYYNGKFNLLPENHRIVQMNVKSAWDSWFFGSRVDGVPPYRLVDCKEFRSHERSKKENDNQVSLYSKIKKVSLTLLKDSQKELKDIISMPIDQSNSVFCAVYTALLERIGLSDEGEAGHHNVNRSYITVYNNILKKENEGKPKRKRKKTSHTALELEVAEMALVEPHN